MLVFVVMMLFYIFIGDVYALTSNLRESYLPGESAIIELSGVVLEDIGHDQIRLKRGHVDIGVEFDIKKLEGRYYLWFIVPKQVGNYTLVIEDVVSMVGGEPSVIDYSKDFSVAGDLIEYSIKPGFVYTSRDFEITALLNWDNSKSVSVDFPAVHDVVLQPGENTLRFSIADVVGTKLIIIKIGDYDIPAYIIGKREIVNKTVDGNISNETLALDDDVGEEGGVIVEPVLTREPRFSFEPRVIRSTVLLSGTPPVYQFRILNQGEDGISNLILGYKRGLFSIYPLGNISVGVNNSAQFNLSLKNAPDKEIREVIRGRVGNYSAYLLIKINVTEFENQTSTSYIKKNESGESSLYYCSELSGKLCGGGEVCSVAEVSSIEGECCVGNCIEREEGGSRSWIGYLILVVIVLVLIVIFVKYRKIKPDTNPLATKVSAIKQGLP